MPLKGTEEEEMESRGVGTEREIRRRQEPKRFQRAEEVHKSAANALITPSSGTRGDLTMLRIG